MNLDRIIKHIYPDIQKNEYLLQDDGHGPYIKTWAGKQIKPTIEVLQKNEAAAEAFYQSQYYKIQRFQKYPAITEQLDLLWHAMNDGKLSKNNQFYKTIKKIKDEHPKP